MQILILFYLSVLFLNGIVVVKPHKLQNTFTESHPYPSAPGTESRREKSRIKYQMWNVISAKK